MPKELVSALASGNRLEDETHRHARAQAAHLRGDMGEHAVLGRDFPGPDDVVGHLQQPGYRIVGVVDGVDADDRVAGAVGQSLVNGGPDAFGRIGWVVGLVAAGECARQADRVGAVSSDAQFLRAVDQVEVGHQLCHRGDHLRGQPGGDPADHLAAAAVGEQPLAQLPHRPIPDLGVGGLVHRILDHPCDFVLLVRYCGLLAQRPERHFGQDQAGRNAFGRGLGGYAGQAVARLLLVRLAHEQAQIGELVGLAE